MTPHRGAPTMALAVLVLVLADASAQSPGKDPPPPRPDPSGGQAGQPRPGLQRAAGRLLLGDRGPDFELADGTDKLRLKELRGSYAAILVFSQRPSPAFAAYAALGDSLRSDGVRVLLICRQDLPERGSQWSGASILYDRWGDVARNYGAWDPVTRDTVPAIFLLDRDGYVRFQSVGHLLGPGLLREAVSALLLTEGPAGS